jgi:FdrA protein
MGPDCGTAIINGIALGFANKVKRGTVGIVGAAGTGIQEASVILSRLGVGISQAIGTGGRDLKSAIGGITMLMGIEALQQDAQTQIILIISKPPAEEVEAKILEKIKTLTKPVVVNFLGGNLKKARALGFNVAETLEEGAQKAAGTGGC